MRLIRKLLFTAATVSLTALTAFGGGGALASPGAPQNGVEYTTLPAAQHTDTGSKVEVIEFFTYSCPHCFSFDPILTAWVKKNADKVVFKRIHVAFNASDSALLRLFVTTEAMDISAQTHSKIFSTIHQEGQRLNTDEAIFNWVEKNGVARDKFINAYRSFGIQARVNRAQSMAGAYRIEQWPLIAVGGRYMTSPYLASSGVKPPPPETEQQKMVLQVMDHLVAKARAENK